MNNSGEEADPKDVVVGINDSGGEEPDEAGESEGSKTAEEMEPKSD